MMKNEIPIYASMRRSPLTGTVDRSNDFNQIKSFYVYLNPILYNVN